MKNQYKTFLFCLQVFRTHLPAINIPVNPLFLEGKRKRDVCDVCESLANLHIRFQFGKYIIFIKFWFGECN